jgi:hypothetical protein
VQGAPALAAGFLVVGLSELSAAFKQGVMIPHPDLLLAKPMDGAGAAALLFTWPAGVTSGASFWSQWWTVDAGGPAGFAASNGLRGTAP